MKKIVLKIAIISDLTRLIVELSLSAHQVVFPFPLIATSLLVSILSVTLALPVQFVPLISTTVLELVDRKDRFLLFKVKLLRVLTDWRLQSRRKPLGFAVEVLNWRCPNSRIWKNQLFWRLMPDDDRVSVGEIGMRRQ